MSVRVERFETQGPDEKILFVLRAHPIVNLGWILFGALFLLLPILLTTLLPIFSVSLPAAISARGIFGLVLVWYLITFGVVLQNFLLWYFNIYIITNKRVVDIDFYHLFYKQVSEAPLENVQDITNREVGILQNWLDFGDVFIQTAGETENFEFTNVTDPDGVQKNLLDLVATAKRNIFSKT